MTGSQFTSSDLERQMEPVAKVLLGEPNHSLSTKCELRFGSKGSLAINVAHGTFFDHEVGQGGGVLDLIERETGLTGRDAFEWLESGLGSAGLPRPCQERRQLSKVERETSRRQETLSASWRCFWDACAAITADDPAGRYLLERACALPPLDSDLRWHPSVRHPSGWTSPLLAALISDIHSCEPLSLVRTWIDPSRPGKKAPIKRPRMLLKGHRKQGGVIRLWPDDSVTDGLLVAEGIETALSAARAFRPVWSLIDAGNLATFPVLPSIETLTVAVDHDDAGLKAWRAVAERWIAAGLEVRRWLSETPGDDLNDHAFKVANIE